MTLFFVTLPLTGTLTVEIPKPTTMSAATTLSTATATLSDILAAHAAFKSSVAEFGIPFPLTAQGLKGVSFAKLDYLRAVNRRVDETAFRAREPSLWHTRGYTHPTWVVMAHRAVVSIHVTNTLDGVDGELEAIESATRVANNPLRSICVLHVSSEGIIL